MSLRNINIDVSLLPIFLKFKNLISVLVQDNFSEAKKGTIFKSFSPYFFNQKEMASELSQVGLDEEESSKLLSLQNLSPEFPNSDLLVDDLNDTNVRTTDHFINVVYNESMNRLNKLLNSKISKINLKLNSKMNMCSYFYTNENYIVTIFYMDEPDMSLDLLITDINANMADHLKKFQNS